MMHWRNYTGWLAAVATCSTAFAQLDETWTLNVNGQVGRPNANGSFLISNIPGLDGAPGVPPDGWGEDLIRLTGISTAGGITRYVYSNFFQIRSGGVIQLSDLTFDFAPPPIPESVTVFNSSRLMELGQSSQLAVIAQLLGPQYAGGLDVTRRLDGTVYWTSNLAIATVTPNGLVTAHGLGTAYVTAVNQGATGVTRIDVLPEVLDTTVEGYVLDPDGAPVLAAQVTTNFGGLTNTNADGFFSVSVQYAPDTDLTVTVEKVINEVPYFGRAANLAAVNNGLTDAGIIAIAPLCDGLFFSVGESVGTSGGSGGVYAIVEFNGALCAAGAFSFAGGEVVNGVARWNGQSWSPLGGGMNEDVLTLAVYDDGKGPALYAGGRFTLADGQTANRVARWDGLGWAPLGGGMDQVVNALVVHNDGTGVALYAGGRFTNAGGTTALRIARWRGGAWEPVGPGFNQEVFTLFSGEDDEKSALYAGGSFTFVGGGGAQARRIAKWDGVAWSQVGVGLNNTVNTLESFDDGSGAKLYVGGAFTAPGSGSGALNRIARWSGKAWEPLGEGLNQRVNAIHAMGSGGKGALYVGGFFTQAGGAPANHVSVWDGATWSVPAQGDFDDYVNGFGEFEGALYAGGNFTRGGGIRVNNIARQGEESWTPLGNGLNEPVDALAVYSGPVAAGIYAGGAFTHAGSELANYVAYWNGAQWLPAGDGFDDGVFALVAHDDGTGPAVFAGGNFTQSGATVMNHIAKWNGISWQPLLSGIDGPVYAAVSYNDGSGPVLVVGGDFTQAGGVPARGMAAWDGVSWSEFNGGVDGVVYAFSVLSGDNAGLYVGGEFAEAGGTPALRAARWDGASWSALGAGANNTVYALAVYNDDLGPAIYAGGAFTQIGGQNANRVAKWSGTAWSALGSGVNNDVYALSPFDDSMERQLIAGGRFSQAGGLSANRAAAWNGTTWAPLAAPTGNGLSDRVNAFVVQDDGSGQSLYVGGDFQNAAGQQRGFIARWARPAECR